MGLHSAFWLITRESEKVSFIFLQADVLRACGITQLLDAALAGFNVTILTYGQTGSGKTFTMSGREDILEMDDYNGESSFAQRPPVLMAKQAS